MNFPFSVAATAFAFSAGVIAAGIFYFVIMALRKKKISGAKISIFIASFAVIAAAVCSYFVYFPEYKFPFSFLTKGDLIYLAIVFVLGILFLLFTAICLYSLLPAYLIFSCITFLSLWSLYPRKQFFEYTQTSADANKVVIVCHEINPYILLPGPRIWYETETAEERKINPLFTFIDRTVLKEEKKVTVELPAQDYYPVVYKLNIKCSASNLLIKAEPVL